MCSVSSTADQLAKATSRSRYAHTPVGLAPLQVKLVEGRLEGWGESSGGNRRRLCVEFRVKTDFRPKVDVVKIMFAFSLHLLYRIATLQGMRFALSPV